MKLLFLLTFILACFDAATAYNADLPGLGIMVLFLVGLLLLVRVCLD